MSRSRSRLLTVVAAAAAVVGLTAVPALAHVTVSSPDATRGGYGKLTFRVPTERDTASTIGLKVQLPADPPLSFVSVKPKPGWTYTVTRATLATPVRTGDRAVTDHPSVVEWKAASAAAGIGPGQFEEFELSVGPLPATASVTFKAVQTYSDRTVVSWIEEPAAGSAEEPDHPAPTLTLPAADGPGADGGSAATGTAATGTTGGPTRAVAADAASRESVTGAYVLGGAGLVAGVGALALSLRRRRPPATG